jgi:hypothetical protein
LAHKNTRRSAHNDEGAPSMHTNVIGQPAMDRKLLDSLYGY